MKKLTILLLFISQISIAQTSLINKTISQIDLKSDTIKSVFDWVTDNIKYDVKKLNKMQKGSYSNNSSDFDNKKDYQADKLKKVIKRKKGVCEDYSLLFNTLVSQLGYDSYVVTGYTKNNKGKLNRKVGHTWNAVKVNGKWRLYDPTWGAGYVKNNKKFLKHYNIEWYDVSPTEMVKTHMPYDPIWQLSSSPISYKAFEKPKLSSTSKENYNYNELIQIYSSKTEKEQMKAQVSRSEEMGKGIRLIDKWRKRKTKNITSHNLNNQMDLFNETSAQSFKSIELFNKYIDAKNNRFRGRKWTVDYAKQQLIQEKEQIKNHIDIFESLEVKNKKANNMIKRSIKQSEKFLKQMDSELKYLRNFNN